MIEKANLQALAFDLQGKEVEVRLTAASRLKDYCQRSEVGDAARVILPALVNSLSDDEEQIGYDAACGLAALGVDGEAAVPALLATLKDMRLSGRVRGRAATALCSIAGTGVLGELTELLRHHELFLRRESAHALGYLGPEAAAAVPELIRLFEDDDSEVRAITAESLTNVGTAAEPELKKALLSGSPRIRGYAAEVLIAIDRSCHDAIRIATEALRNSEPACRIQGALVLERAGRNAATAVSELALALQDTETEVRHFAAMALCAIGPECRSAVPALIDAYLDENEEVRFLAIAAFEAIGPDAIAALPTVKRALKDPSPDVQQIARTALQSIRRKR
jgi:HEAT repeat protein